MKAIALGKSDTVLSMQPYILDNTYTPPWQLRNGLTMTVYSATRASQDWERTTLTPTTTVPRDGFYRSRRSTNFWLGCHP